MVVSNPVPPELQGRLFVEQARALPARVALEAFFAAAAGFTDDSGSAGIARLDELLPWSNGAGELTVAGAVSSAPHSASTAA
jgi:hypothetical protein